MSLLLRPFRTLLPESPVRLSLLLDLRTFSTPFRVSLPSPVAVPAARLTVTPAADDSNVAVSMPLSPL